jgi:large subunit ribosomal protein LX
MSDTAFTVRGTFQARDGRQEFESEVEAPNEDVAEERAYSTLGSRHALERTQIEIEEVSR